MGLSESMESTTENCSKCWGAGQWAKKISQRVKEKELLFNLDLCQSLWLINAQTRLSDL